MMRDAVRSLAIVFGLAPAVAGCSENATCVMDAGDAAPLDANGDAPGAADAATDRANEAAGDAPAVDAISDSATDGLQ